LKTLIYQYYIDKNGGPPPKWAVKSVELFREYAEKHGAVHAFKSTGDYAFDPHYEYFELFYNERFHDYDRVLYVDVDVIPEKDDNIFEVDMTGYHVAGVPERSYSGHVRAPGMQLKGNRLRFKEASVEYQFPFTEKSDWGGEYLIYNSGVLLFTKDGLQQARKTFMDWGKWYRSHAGQFRLDQPFINTQILKHMKHKELEMKWNCLPRIRFEEGTFPDDAVFVHYTSKKKDLIMETYT